MPKQNNDYTNILKSTSLFGAVQVFAILISVIRSKAVAILIGPAGMGIIGLIMSTLKVVGEITTLGLSTTAVREIAIAKSNENDRESSTIIATIRKVVWFTGVLGVLMTAIISPLLSHLAFDNYDYTLAFVCVSLSLLFNQLSAGQLSILQGFRKLKMLAKANLFGNLLGLIVSLPLYYIFRIDAIVPVIIISSLASLLMSWIYSNKLKYKSIKLTNRQAYQKAKSMLNLGLMLSLRSSIALIAAYIFQIYLSKVGGVDEVGYFIAGFVIINAYVGMVFKAMQTDYFPKLSGVIDSVVDFNTLVNQQSIIAILIIGPLVVVFLSFLPIIVNILYTDEFLIIVGFLAWAILGVLFKTLSWSMGYVILAKGDSKLFIKTGAFFSSLLLILNILGYYFHGLEGLGISFLVYYICHFVGLKIITSYYYSVKLNIELLVIFIVLFVLSSVTFGVTFIESAVYKYSLCSILIMITLLYSFRQLNKRVNLRGLLIRFYQKNR